MAPKKRNVRAGGDSGGRDEKRRREESMSVPEGSVASSQGDGVLQTTHGNVKDRSVGGSNKVQFSWKSGRPTQNEVPTIVAVLPEREQPSTTGGSDTQSSEWYESIRLKGLRSKDSMQALDLVAYVRQDLFPKLKFIMDERQLLYTEDKKTICQKIMDDMGVIETRRQSWWELYKNTILKRLNSKRADVTSAIKRRFVSK
jgi:hypothetical protein